MQDMEHVMYDQKKTTYSVTRHVITDKSEFAKFPTISATV